MLMRSDEFAVEAEVERRLQSRTPPTAERLEAPDKAVEESVATTYPDLGCNPTPTVERERSDIMSMSARLKAGPD